MDAPGKSNVNTLPVTDAERLAVCEAIVTRSLRRHVLDVGKALDEINGGKLYKSNYKTFDGYVQARWGFSRTYAYRMIAASRTIENLLPIGDAFAPLVSESQLRPLVVLTDAMEQQRAWKSAVDEADGCPPTAEQVKAAILRMHPPTPKVRGMKPINVGSPSDTAASHDLVGGNDHPPFSSEDEDADDRTDHESQKATKSSLPPSNAVRDKRELPQDSDALPRVGGGDGCPTVNRTGVGNIEPVGGGQPSIVAPPAVENVEKNLAINIPVALSPFSPSEAAPVVGSTAQPSVRFTFTDGTEVISTIFSGKGEITTRLVQSGLTLAARRSATCPPSEVARRQQHVVMLAESLDQATQEKAGLSARQALRDIEYAVFIWKNLLDKKKKRQA